jgi:hypothetical protein
MVFSAIDRWKIYNKVEKKNDLENNSILAKI